MDSTNARRTSSRRGFLKATTAAAVGLAASRVAPARVLGANDRVSFGVIGCGGQGTGHVNGLVGRGGADNIDVLAVADVYRRRVTRAQEISRGDGYLDYRKLIERNDIDAVLIATSDHWHAKIAMDALESGKHVYVEKPMTHTISQALALRDTVRRTKLVLQVGPQATGNDRYWQAHQAIKAGKIGKVTWAQASCNRNARACLFNEHQKIDPAAGPDRTGEDFIDWDMWLGHKWDLAPKISWIPDHFFRFRKYWPYSGGVATDVLYHKLAPLLIAMAGPNGEYPTRVNASGRLYIEKDGRDSPDMFLMTADYPSEYSIFLISTLTNDSSVPERIYGKFGTMDLDGDVKMNPNGQFSEEFSKNIGGAQASIPSKQKRDIVGNFIDNVRGRDNTLYCNVELGAATMVAIKMAVESYRQQKTMVWDSKKEHVAGARAFDV